MGFSLCFNLIICTHSAVRVVYPIVVKLVLFLWVIPPQPNKLLGGMAASCSVLSTEQTKVGTPAIASGPGNAQTGEKAGESDGSQRRWNV